jgi:putative membrane protein
MYPSKRYSSLVMSLVFAASWLYPKWPVEQALHSSLTLVGFALLWYCSTRLAMNDRDFLMVALFLSVHSIAARWLYSYVPYDAWVKSLFDVSINQTFGWTRNHFDRLVHFLFGLCFTPGIISYVLGKYRVTRRRALYVAISAVMIASLWYEWFEFAVAMTLSAEDAESYNGQQGDMWDAHKDMLVATIGSIFWLWPYRSSSMADMHTRSGLTAQAPLEAKKPNKVSEVQAVEEKQPQHHEDGV